MENTSRELLNLASNSGGVENSLENYSVEKKIGHGQFSVVYRARCKLSNQIVALKKVQLFEMTDAKARLDCMKEINLLQQLIHPNIIRYRASFIDSNQLNIVLELADAGDLQRMIRHFRSHKRLIAERTIWRYFAQVCCALQYMHQKRIMHRDIKPANVFLTGKGVVKLGDLGLGRYFSTCTTELMTLVGTPYYMSPERIHERSYSFKSDVWSLGCLLYEMAALQSPFFADKLTLHALCRRIEKCDYSPLPSTRYSTQLCSLINVCLTSEPEDRADIDHVTKIASEMQQKNANSSSSAVSTSSSVADISTNASSAGQHKSSSRHAKISLPRKLNNPS